MSITSSNASQQKPISPGAWSFSKEMLGYARPYWGKGVLCLLAVMVRAGFLLAMPVFYREIFDGVLGNNDRELLVRLLGILAIGFGILILANLVQAYLASALAAGIMRDLRRKMYEHLQRLSEV